MPTIERESGSVYFNVRGNGPSTVVLLHDFFGTHRSWTMVQAQLSRYFTVIAPDLRGHGRSALRQGEMSVTAMSDDVSAVLDNMDISTAHVIGCSHGAVVAMHMARTAPERVASIVITSVPDLNDPDIIDYGRQYASTVFPRLEARLDEEHGEQRPGYSREILLKRFTQSLEHPPDDHLDAVRKADEISQPVLILGGDDDPVMIPDRALSLWRRMQSANLGIIPDTGHLAHQESPATYTGMVLDYLWRQT